MNTNKLTILNKTEINQICGGLCDPNLNLDDYSTCLHKELKIHNTILIAATSITAALAITGITIFFRAQNMHIQKETIALLTNEAVTLTLQKIQKIMMDGGDSPNETPV